MKFLAALSLLTLATALPHDGASTNALGGLEHQGPDHIRWPVPSGMTVKEASAKCGDQAQLSCCNKAKYAGDTTDVADGLGAGLLSDLIGTGSGAEGLGVFDQCSKLPIQIPVALIIGVNDVLDQKCKQNIACCAKSPASANADLVGAGLPCVALGSIL